MPNVYQLPPVTMYPEGSEPEPDDTVSLGGPQKDVDTGVSLSPAGAPVQSVPDDIATVRAKKMQEGLGSTLQKDTDTIKQEIAAGRENILRQQAASKQMYDNSVQKMNMLSNLATQKGGPLDEDEVAKVMDPFNPWNRPVDPNSVVEKAYSQKFIGSIKDAIDSVKSSPLQDAQQEIPEQVQAAEDKASLLKTRMEIATKVKDDLGMLIHQQGTMGYLADQVKNMFQPYVEAKMRGQNPNVGSISGGILLGENLQAQADDLFSPISTPTDELFYTKLKTITDGIAKDNPSLAYRFAEYVEGLPRSDRILDNTFTLMAVPDYVSMGKIGLNVARKASLYNRTNIAMKQLVKEGDKVAADKAGRAEALGDLPNAVTDRATKNVTDSVNDKFDAVKFATDDSLLTLLNQDKDKIATDAGSLSREQVVRIQDAYDASGKTLLARIMDAVRINRIPMAVATQNAVRIIKDAVKEYYPGIRNAILDVSNPLYESKSNTYWHDVTFGNIGGDLFSNPKTAKNFADLHGLDAEIVEAYGKVTPKQTEDMLARRTVVENNIRDAESAIQGHKNTLKDEKATDEAKVYAKEQSEGLTKHKKAFEQEADDLSLKLKNKETYDRVKQLESEITQFQIRNKELRSAAKSEKDAAVKSHINDSIKFAAEQIKGKAQEVNAIKQGTAEVRSATTVEQHGVGFKIVVRRPLVETDKAVRDLMIRDASGKLIPEAISTSSSTGFKSLFNAYLGKFRGADDTLALNESIQRKIGTYSQSMFKQWAYQEAQYIKDLASGVVRNDPVTGAPIPFAKARSYFNKPGDTKKHFSEFSRTLDFARDAHDPITGKIGYFFETPGQLDNHYLTNFDRLPSFADHQAYFAFVRMVEGDRVMREVAEFRNRARLGVEQFSLSARGPDGKMVKSDFFDGVRRKTFPGGDDVLMVMGRRQGEEKLVNLGGSAIAPNQLKEWRDAVTQGKLHVIEVYASEHTPLRDFSDVAGNEHVRYVLTDANTSKPLEFNHVNRRGGGHFEYDYEHYIKQAKMYHQYENSPGIKGKYRSVYTGDTTFMPIQNRVMGNDISKKLNTIQGMIRSGALEDAKRFTEAYLPIEWDELHGMFKPGRDDAGKVLPPALSLEEPFVTVPKNRSVLDMNSDLQLRHGKAFKDGSKSGSLNQQFKTAFNTERESSGLRTFEDRGTTGNPLYKYDPEGAKMVDPIPTMNRALNRIINSTFMDDYKIYAVEHWLREAEKHLELKEGQIESSPFWAFQQANDKTAFRAGTLDEVVKNLLSNRQKILAFTGVPNATQTAIHSATQMLIDHAYTNYGPVANRSLAAKAFTLAPEWMLSRITDPITFMRSMTFHFKLGLFATPQLLVQMQTYASILSISPFHGVAGSYAALLHGWAGLNGEAHVLRGLDNAATKISVLGQSRWRPGEFLEAKQVADRTGFLHVAGEYANVDTAMKHNYFSGDGKALLKAGTIFFEKGEQATRIGAWYTAFREFREVNPSKILTRDDIGKILNRADLLTINMSRASNSILHGGVASLTTQFITYQLRAAELFMGKRLGDTLYERNMARFRMLTFYAALYGAPSAIGLTGLPLANNIREEAIQRGYVVGDNWVKTTIDQGLPAMMMYLATGNHYNIGDRFGSPGFTQLSDALKSNTPWYQLLAGASGTTLINTLTATSPYWHWVGSQLSSDNSKRAFPSKLDDFVGLFKEISSVNQSWKLIAAINTGKWMSKNEAYIGDVSKANAAFMAVFGINPQQQDDLYLKNDIRKAEIEYQKHTLKEFITEYRRGIAAASEGNPSQAKEYYTRAFTMLEISGYPMDKKATAISLAAKGHESQIKDADYEFAFKGVPQTRSSFMGIPTPFTTQSNIPQTRRDQFQTQTRLDKN